MNTNVEKQFAEAKLLFHKVGWIIQFLSAWPLNPTNTKLILFLLYLIYENVYLLIAFNDFFSIFGDLQLMTANLIGSLVQTIMMIRLIFVKFSKKVRNIIIEIQDDVCEKNYKNLDDKKIYVQYSSLAMKFYKVTMGFGTGAGLSFFILPLQNCILSSPLPVTALCFFASVNMQFIIITNICARIAILTSKIKKVRGEVESVSVIKHIVLKHLELIRLTKKVDEIWTPVFCVEIIVLIPLLALVMFSAILALEANETIAFMTLFTYVGAVLSCLFANCLMGELLLTEREQLLEAFYLCNWYKMSIECKRSWLICMVNCAKIPMHMTAGKIYIYSFNGFTGILKSSMGYVSLLRTLTM